MGERVLVTGGTGYLAAWVIARLLRSGHQVRTTVRDAGKADQVRAAVGEEAGEAATSLDVVVADLLADDGWDEAVAGVDHVIHTASPLGTAPGTDVVRTAREGVRRVLGAAVRVGVRRVVVTSSGVTVVPDEPGAAADESVWATPSDDPRQEYAASKILAERDAWDQAARTGLELVTVLPTFMQGPALGRPSPAGSTQVVARLLDGSLPAVPRIGWDVVDVRDVADLHVLAMTAPQAAGRRLLGAGTFMWWSDLAKVLKDQLPEQTARVPVRTMPDLLVKVLARTNPQMATIRPALGRKVVVDGSATRRLVGWHPRPVHETLADTATSLLTTPTVRSTSDVRA